MTTRIRHTVLFSLIALMGASTAEAQIWNRVKRAAQRGAERAVERQAEERARRAANAAIDGLFDAGENAVRCVFTDEDCIRHASDNGEDVVLVDDDGAPVDRNGNPVTENNPEDAIVRAPAASASSGGASAGTATARPGQGAWANYDFVPGERPLYIENFESDYVGNVPRRIDFHAGVMEVVSENNNQMLRFGDASSFAIPLPEVLPERFTIEFDLYHGDDWNYTTIATGPLDDPADGYHTFHGDMRNHSAAEFRVGSIFETGVAAGQSGGSSLINQDAHEQGMVPVRIAVDGQYVKMYIGERRVANIPNADIQRTDRIRWAVAGEVSAVDDDRVGPILVDNIRVAAGGRQILYDQLLADGRVATHGLLFDTGSSCIKPESAPTLQNICA